MNEEIAYILATVFGNILLLEGGIAYVVLGIVLYLCKESRKKLTWGYLSFVIIYFLIYNLNIVNRFTYFLYVHGLSMLADLIDFINGAILDFNWLGITGIESLFTVNYQWFMIAALPFMLGYNGQRGLRLKYFFYIFYPLHILILFYIGNVVFNT